MTGRPSFFAELKRRNVLRAGAFYLAAAWLLAQIVTQILPVFDVPSSWLRWVIVALAVGFPFWLAFSWFYEITPEGIKRESDIEAHESITRYTGRKLDFAIIGVLAVAVVLLLTDRFVLRHGPNQEDAAIAEKSIAVLPFVNMSSDKEQEYFSDGISEEMLNLLAKIPELKVSARTSSFSFKGKQVDVPEIAKQLHVAHVLEGSVRKVGNAVRITAQLIHAADGFNLWSETYDRKLDDIFAIQDEIASDVVKQLKVTMLGAAPKVRTTDPQAYALYLQATQVSKERTAEGFAKADALYRQVQEIDPRYAPAWHGLAANLTNEVSLGLMPSEEGFARAKEAAEKAFAIDPDYAPAHARLGWIAMYGNNDLAAAAKHFERALTLDPTDLNVLSDSATLLQNLGRLDEALALEEAVFRRDPVNVTVLSNLGMYRLRAGLLDPAIETFHTALSLNPRRGTAHYGVGVALLLKRDAAGALAEIEQENSKVWRMIGLPMAYHALERKADADQALAALIEKYGKDAPFNIACVYVFRGEADKAFDWLDKAVEYQDAGLSEVVSERLLVKIHDDPRWLPFLRKLGKAPEQLEKIEFKVTLPKQWAAEAAAASHAI